MIPGIRWARSLYHSRRYRADLRANVGRNGSAISKIKVLVTGRSDYIGSHTCEELLNIGYDVVVVDNLCNSRAVALERVEKAHRQVYPLL